MVLLCVCATIKSRGLTMKRRTRVIVTFCVVAWSCTLVAARRAHHRHGLGPDCSKCPPGFGVVQRCGHGRDTECAPCRPGTYSPHHSYKLPCYPCSLCGAGLYVAHSCTATRDTICDSCHTYRGPHNRNFYLRCLLRTNSAVPPPEHLLTNELLIKAHPDKNRNSVTRQKNGTVSQTEDITSQWETSGNVPEAEHQSADRSEEGSIEKVAKSSAMESVHQPYQRVALVTGILATCAIFGVLGTLIVRWSCNSRHRKARPGYPYQAVRTRDAVML